MPVSLTLQHTAWREGALIRYASAIEDLLLSSLSSLSLSSSSLGTDSAADEAGTSPCRQALGRIPPLYKCHLAKNIPVESEYRFPGAKTVREKDGAQLSFPRGQGMGVKRLHMRHHYMDVGVDDYDDGDGCTF